MNQCRRRTRRRYFRPDCVAAIPQSDGQIGCGLGPETHTGRGFTLIFADRSRVNPRRSASGFIWSIRDVLEDGDGAGVEGDRQVPRVRHRALNGFDPVGIFQRGGVHKFGFHRVDHHLGVRGDGRALQAGEQGIAVALVPQKPKTSACAVRI